MTVMNCLALRVIVILTTGIMIVLPARALELEFLDGDLTIDVRTQLNYGISTSVEKVDKDYLWGLPANHLLTRDADIATAHGGTGSGLISQDDGRLIHKRGVYQNQVKGITDIRAGYGDFGAIVKVLYFYDQAVMNKGSQARTVTQPHNTWTAGDGAPGGVVPMDTGVRATREVEFADAAIEQIGRDVTTKEAYLFYDGYVGDFWETGTFLDDISLNVRIGDQIIRWGQSTFNPGISVFNPLDVNRVLTPGFDLAELAGPVGGLFVSAAVTDWMTVETWAGYDFQPLQLPPGGSFFTYYDPAGAGVDAYSGTGEGFCLPFSQFESAWNRPNGHPSGLGGACIPLQTAQFARDSGMYGLRMAFALPFQLFNSVDFYVTQYHNTFPVVQVTQTGVLPNAIPCELVDTPMATGGDGDGEALGAVLEGLNGGDETEEAGCRNVLPMALNDLPGNDPAGGLINKQGDILKVGLAFPEALKGFGITWTGNLPYGGFTWAGELSYRPDLPIQVALPEILSATGFAHSNTEGINAFIPLLGLNIPEAFTAREADDLTNGNLYIPRNINCFEYGLLCEGAQSVNGGGLADSSPNVGTGQNSAEPFDAATCGPTRNGLGGGGCDGTVAFGVNPAGTPAQGWVPLDVYQLNLSFTKILSNIFWQDNIIFLSEFVGVYVDGMDDFNFGFDAPNYRLSRPTEEPTADDWGWGYRLLLLAQRPQLMGTKVDLTTTFIWFHDVKNTTPTNLNLFVEDRMQGILQFDFKYGTFLTTFRYLYFGGGKGQNPFIDRDTFQVNFRYTM